MVLYSAVSSPLDSSKRFTLSSPGRPVHSGTNAASLGSILAVRRLAAASQTRTTVTNLLHTCAITVGVIYCVYNNTFKTVFLTMNVH